MSDRVTNWLEQLGLVQYAHLFVENNLDWELLTDLDHEILKDIGISSAGHRLRILRAAGVLSAQREENRTPREETAASVVSESGRTEAERRQLTVMFCDLVGSTELSQQLDPEDLRDVNRAYQNACKAVIEQFEGFVARYMGDALLAYFGYPHAHENDAERAVLAGLAIVEAVNELQAEIGNDKGIVLSVRVGVATGLVVVGDLIGEGASQESPVVGETPNLAARLQSLASSGTVVVAAGTHDLCSGLFKFADLGMHQLKGIANMVKVWHVTEPIAVESRFDAVRNKGLTTFHGRENELALLSERWLAVKNGKGQMLLLSGEAGIGKSRITRVFRKTLAEENCVILRFQCSPYHTNSALYPIIKNIQIAADIGSHDSAEHKLVKLNLFLDQAGIETTQSRALIALLLSIPTQEHYPEFDYPPQELMKQTLWTLVNWLRGLAFRLPVLFELEDAHWIDPTTIELINLVLEEIQDLQVLILITFRNDYDCPWTDHANTSLLSLNHLTRNRSRQIIIAISEGKEMPTEVMEQILEKADGIPLYLEELTKNVLESGMLVEDRGRLKVDHPSPVLAIPTSLQDSLMARLDRLGPAKVLAQIGSAIGREFSYELLESVTCKSGYELGSGLGKLVEARLVFSRDARPGVSYLFKHALIQDAAYESMLKSHRRKLHSKIANAIEENFPDQIESQPEMLARHWSESGNVKKALPYWLAAGKHASERFANTEAASHLNCGLKLVDGLPEGPEREQNELEFRVALGTVLRISEGPGAKITLANNNRAVDLCDHLPESPEQFAALWSKWQNTMNLKLDTGIQWTERLTALAGKLGDPVYMLQALHAKWTTQFHIGEFTEAYTHIREALGLYDEKTHHIHAALYGGHDARICGGGFASHALWMLGHPDQSLEFAKKCVIWEERLNHTGSSLHVAENMLLLYQFRREPYQLLPWIEKMEAICLANDLPEYEGKLNFNRGWFLASQGDTEAGIKMMRKGIQIQRTIGSLEDIPMFNAKLSGYLSKSGQIEDGLKIIEEALNIIESHSLRYWTAEVHRRKGELLNLIGQQELAFRSLKEALQIARDQKAKSLELRAAISLARWYVELGEISSAASLLQPIYDWFSEGLDTPDLKEAHTLLSELA